MLISVWAYISKDADGEPVQRPFWASLEMNCLDLDIVWKKVIKVHRENTEFIIFFVEFDQTLQI